MKSNIKKHNKYFCNSIECLENLIVFEGNDGAGKSTIVKLISKILKSKGNRVKIMRFNMSYVTLPAIKIGKSMKFGVYTNTFLHVTSIIDQFERWILYELKKGTIILCDRYLYSVLCRGMARGLTIEDMEYFLNLIHKPSLSIYLDITPKGSLKRLNIKDISYWEAGEDIYRNDILSKQDKFILFQSEVRKNFIYFKDIFSFNIIDSEEEITYIIKKIMELINLRNIN